jgi:hypothetical protein
MVQATHFQKKNSGKGNNYWLINSPNLPVTEIFIPNSQYTTEDEGRYSKLRQKAAQVYVVSEGQII